MGCAQVNQLPIKRPNTNVYLDKGLSMANKKKRADYLNFANEPEITNNLDYDENIVLSIGVLKCNRFAKWQ